MGKFLSETSHDILGNTSYSVAIAAFGEAAWDAGKWPYALEALSRASRSEGAVLIALQGSMPMLPGSPSLDVIDEFTREPDDQDRPQAESRRSDRHALRPVHPARRA
jgi:hypothetical protein